MTSQEYQMLVDSIRQKYPPLKRHRFDIITGSGPGEFVFFPAHARQTPRPGTHCIETREAGRKLENPAEIERHITREMFTLLGMLDNEGTPYVMKGWPAGEETPPVQEAAQLPAVEQPTKPKRKRASAS